MAVAVAATAGGLAAAPAQADTTDAVDSTVVAPVQTVVPVVPVAPQRGTMRASAFRDTGWGF